MFVTLFTDGQTVPGGIYGCFDLAMRALQAVRIFYVANGCRPRMTFATTDHALKHTETLATRDNRSIVLEIWELDYIEE